MRIDRFIPQKQLYLKESLWFVLVIVLSFGGYTVSKLLSFRMVIVNARWPALGSYTMAGIIRPRILLGFLLA